MSEESSRASERMRLTDEDLVLCDEGVAIAAGSLHSCGVGSRCVGSGGGEDDDDKEDGSARTGAGQGRFQRGTLRNESGAPACTDTVSAAIRSERF